MSADQPVNRAGSWWRRQEGAGWLRWNEFTEQWEPSTSAPPPPAPPPPPPAVPGSAAPTSRGPSAPARAPMRRGFDPQAIRSRLPYWADGPLGIAIAAGLVVILIAGSAMAYTLLTSDPPKEYAPIEVEAYGGPVSWRGQKDVYDRLKHITGCTPQDIQGIKRDFGDVHTTKGRIRYLKDGVQGLRGLSFVEEPKMSFLTQRELGREVARLVNDEYDRAQSNLDAEVLSMLGAVPPGTRFGRLKGADAAAAIAGMYVPERKRLYVGESAGSNLLDELTLAHELQHALADQAFGLGDGDLGVISDERNAMKALTEGDAELTAAHYDMVLDIETQFQLADTSAAGQAAQDAEYPGYFIERGFYFPYLEGTLFVCELYAIDGWDAVDAAYRDPPTTTAEILFPERYIFKIAPQDPTDPPTPQGWKKQDVHSMGAADLLWLFQAPSGHLQPKLMKNAQSVKRWNGGELHVFRRGRDLAVSMALVDGKEDAKGKKASPTLCRRVKDWYSKAFAGSRRRNGRTTTWRHGGRVATLVCGGEGPRLSIAPNVPTSEALSR